MTLYVRGAGMALARIEVDTVALTYTRIYLHPDQLGSATAGTSQSGAVLWREQYAPYGDKLTAPAANDDLGSFIGHYYQINPRLFAYFMSLSQLV